MSTPDVPSEETDAEKADREYRERVRELVADLSVRWADAFEALAEL